MIQAEVRLAEFSDAALLAPIVRRADRREIQDLYGKSPKEIIEASILRQTPKKVFSIKAGSRVLGMFGVSTQGFDKRGIVGSPWFVGTDELFKVYRRRFIRESGYWIDEVAQGYSLLMNFVSAENTVHISWLEHFGFVLVERIDELGVARKPYWRFEMDLSNTIRADIASD